MPAVVTPKLAALFHFLPVLAFLQKDGEIVLMKRYEDLASAICWLIVHF